MKPTLTANRLPPRAEMVDAYLRRDSAYDGIFYIGVRTTTIFCRPTCKVRSPLPKNVEFYSSAAAAMFAGYRPCKRCRPLSLVNESTWVQPLIAQVEQRPTERITESALRQFGVDPATVRRHFVKNYGMTFQAYARSCRLSYALKLIREGRTLDDVILDSGYESHSGFRDAFTQWLGCPPGQAAAADCIQMAWMHTPLGPMIGGANNGAICFLEFTDRRMLEAQWKTLRQRFRVPVMIGQNRLLEQLQTELTQYFEGSLQEFTLPLQYPGTEFQQAVWNELLKVPYGQTRSYQELASSVGDAKAVRAVGRTNGLNRISILIPCHRIVNKSGDLGGYGGGLRRKEFLLHLEKSNVASVV